MLKFTIALLSVITIGVVSGCASTIKLKQAPLVVYKPCLSEPIPTRKVILLITKPYPVPYTIDGVDKIGMGLVVDHEALHAYFQFVEQLEKIAGKAAKCVETGVGK